MLLKVPGQGPIQPGRFGVPPVATGKKRKAKSKLKNDGKAIAELEMARHKAKIAASLRKRHAQRGGPRPSPEAWLDKMMSTRDEQELAWRRCYSRPFSAPTARPPISIINGIFPVDKWKVPISQTLETNASHWGCVWAEPDSWYGDNRVLGVGATTGKPTGITAAAYVGTSTPSIGASTNITYQNLPSVSSEFTSGAESGTEYIQVAMGLAISAYATSNSSNRYTGNMFAVRTIDPHTAPLTGTDIDSLITLAKEDGSKYEIDHYKLSGSGGFHLVRRFVGGSEYLFPMPDTCPDDSSVFVDEGSRAAVVINAVPLTKQSYQYQIINGAMMTTIQQPCSMFILDAVNDGSKFKVDYIGHWCTELIPDFRSDTSAGKTFWGTAWNILMSGTQNAHDAGHHVGDANGVSAWLASKSKDALKGLLENGGTSLGQYIGKKGSKTITSYLKGLFNSGTKSAEGLLESVGNGIIDGSLIRDGAPIIEEILEDGALMVI